ncbi:acetylserotonin O-methyltransferase [Bradyrhizobium sp. WYCCWR 13023]|uniref:Acetylserotonin O-methyltransferase n=1 Tax=Bradyrhizobium zhengyangense TaxID=2911009 RepID=A0A9X1RK84_9BRAD|nr:acetylserotonin O-methyltransferase [Bradyrhizobium zhengyangense]MCG2632214.1 acetylserotonin O-methyltransferase [Bradyrhizobium zhengyangense]MCG2673029.1 acetylserotonin O-methyltransferase [Bradyrhizobium zhengyangense]
MTRNPPEQLLDLVQSHRVTAVIYVAARLGLAELLRDGPRTVDELASRTHADRDALARLLVALSAVGICSRVGEGSYLLTELGAGLDASAERSFKNWVIFEGSMLVRRWGGLLDTIMSGKTAAQLQNVDDNFDLMARTPEHVRVFNEAMTDLTRLVTHDLLQAYDFGTISHLMDVGGGSGQLMGAVAREYPNIKGTVFDLPRCAEAANQNFVHLGISERVDFVAGDFFHTVPAAVDAIILKSIIHDWDDERSRIILGNCRKALPQKGRLLLIERAMSELPGTDDAGRSCAMSDLNMLRGPGGRERTEREYYQLLTESSFRPTAVFRAGRFNLTESRLC